MKLNCDIIADLLPLYIDGSCSEGSRLLVEEHIAKCSECKALLEVMTKDLSLEREDNLENEDKKALQAFHKIRLHWKRSIAIIIVFCLVVTFGILELTGGIALSNIRGIISSRRMMNALIQQDYDKVFSYFNTDIELHDIQGMTAKDLVDIDKSDLTGADWIYWNYKDYTLEEFHHEMEENFISQMKNLNEQGIYITSANYKYVEGNLKDRWRICYALKVIDNKSGETLELLINFWYRKGGFTIAHIMSEDEESFVYKYTADALNYIYNSGIGEKD